MILVVSTAAADTETIRKPGRTTNPLCNKRFLAMSGAVLRKDCLGFVELLAQGIALISPTMTAALIIPVMYGNTGDWSWLVLRTRNRDAAVRRAQPQPVRAALNIVRLDVRLYQPRTWRHRGRHRRMVADLGLSWHFHGRGHRIFDICRQAAGDGGLSDADCWRCSPPASWLPGSAPGRTCSSPRC